ncbi:helix-turn-helix domain-containing protein [Candidatus Pantoea persica]|uniref:helix-turn-helix domain-containing protein n=1 Tax=Candidatus Pantoea persica TaxID=2518128 RepID=UPI00215D6739|nr:LuxR C-terminal-related transcriptional regulator [Candidatus Pantoea persica]MBA2814160.1 helix-turn-helix transcriptional regulator [Candidatus Pantoea persica]
MNCESIEQRPDLLATERELSGMKTPVLGLSTNSHLFHHLYRELPAFRGLIDQESSVEFFISAIRIVAAGGFCYSWDVLESDSNTNEEMYEKAGLTRREREILKLCQSGESNKAISIRLYRSEKNISAHKFNILSKLGMKSSQLIHSAQPINTHTDN